MRSKLPFLFLFTTAVTFIISLIVLAPHLPERIATHFDGSGHANGWMSHGQHLMIMSVIGFGLPAIIIGICFCIRFLPPSALNVPNAAYWRSERNFPEACRIAFHWSLYFAGLSIIFLGGVNFLIVQSNRLSPPYLASVPFLIFVVGFVISEGLLVGLLIFSYFRIKKG